MFTIEEITSLNELESFICEYIQNNMEKVTDMTIRELASEVHVSTTAILRVCKKFGCNGFSEFKVKLKMYIDREKASNEKSDKLIFLDFLDMIQKSKYIEKFNDACNLIRKHKNLYFLGNGISNISANYGAIYFSRLCKFSTLINDLSSLKAYNMLENSVTIVLSVSGETKEILNKVEEVKSLGGKVISITNSSKCKLAKISDVNIPYYSEFNLDKNHYNKAQVIPMFILEKLAENYIKITK